jgi:ammonia channel protein AmtB
VLTRTGGLQRCLPFTLSQLKISAITVPAALVGVWAVLITPAYLGFGDGAAEHTVDEALLMAVATAAAGLLGAIRWVQAKGPDFSAPMISTPSGAFPPGLMTNVFRGFDICLLGTAPMLFGFSPLWSLAICAIAALILLNSMDAEAIRAKQAEQQRELERAKRQREAAATAAKQKKR